MVQKKSLISNLHATKKAVLASKTSTPIQTSTTTSLSKLPVLSKQAAVLSKQATVLSKRTALSKNAAVLSKNAAVLSKQAAVLSKRFTQ
ncbi:MAG: hypothetical protein ACLPND_07025 [Candidatus Korobacteraceae bacterium]